MEGQFFWFEYLLPLRPFGYSQCFEVSLTVFFESIHRMFRWLVAFEHNFLEIRNRPWRKGRKWERGFIIASPSQSAPMNTINHRISSFVNPLWLWLSFSSWTSSARGNNQRRGRSSSFRPRCCSLKWFSVGFVCVDVCALECFFPGKANTAQIQSEVVMVVVVVVCSIGTSLGKKKEKEGEATLWNYMLTLTNEREHGNIGFVDGGVFHFWKSQLDTRPDKPGHRKYLLTHFVP